MSSSAPDSFTPAYSHHGATLRVRDQQRRPEVSFWMVLGAIFLILPAFRFGLAVGGVTTLALVLGMIGWAAIRGTQTVTRVVLEPHGVRITDEREHTSLWIRRGQLQQISHGDEHLLVLHDGSARRIPGNRHSRDDLAWLVGAIREHLHDVPDGPPDGALLRLLDRAQ